MASDATITLRTRADTSGIRTTASEFERAQQIVQRVDREFAKLASDAARLQAAQGNLTGSARTLATGLELVAKGSSEAVRLQTQLANVSAKIASEADRDAAAIRKEADETLRLVQARSRLAIKSGDKAGGAAILQGGISDAQAGGASQKAIISAQTQLNGALNQGETLSQQFGSAFKSSLLGVVGPAAIASAAVAGVVGVVRGSIDAAKQALDLREAQNALKAVSGGVAVYAEALATAHRQQILFGGSLQDNIEGLQGLVITSRDTGANLQGLVDLSQRLEIKSPEQGVAGARLALAEAFSEGNITSLSRRFEIPKAKIAELRDATIPAAEKIKILSGYLDSIGITSAAVAGKVDQTALAYRNLNAELEHSKLSLGGQLADAFSTQATGLARLFGVINENPQAIAEVKALLAGKGGISQGDIDKAAQGVRVNSVSDAAENARKQQLTTAGFTSIAGQFGSGAATPQTDALEAARNKLVVFGATSDDAAAKVNALLAEFGKTGDIDAFNAGVVSAIGSVNHGSRAAKDHTDALVKLRAELADNAEASVKDAAQKDAQGAATNKLAFEINASADAFLRLNPNLDASQAFAAAAAAGLDPLVREIIRLRVEADNTRAALLGGKITAGIAVASKAGGIGRFDRGELQEFKNAGLEQGAAQGRARAAAAAEAQRQADAAAGNLTPALQRAQAELNQLTKDGKTNTAEYINKQQEVKNLQSQQTAQGQKALNDQVAYAKATGDTATARKLLNQELAAAKASGDVGAQAKALEALKALDKQGGAAGGKGLGALDRVDISLAGDYQAQLDAVNKKLAAGHLTELARKQLLKEQLDLQKKIADETDRAANAALDARIAEIENRKTKREEDRRLSAARAVLEHPEQFSQEQKVNAADLVELIPLQQQKRDRDIAAKARVAGIELPGAAQSNPFTPSAAPGAAQAPAGAPPAPAPAQGQGATIQFIIDRTLVASAIIPDVMAALRGATQQVRAAGG